MPGSCTKVRVGQDRHGFDGEIKVGRGAGEAIAVEAFGSDACDGDGLGVDPECAADDGWVASVIVLPGVVAHDGDEWCADNIVRVCEETSDARLQAEGAEVVAGDEFAGDGAGASWVLSGRAMMVPKPDCMAANSSNSGAFFCSCCQVSVANKA